MGSASCMAGRGIKDKSLQPEVHGMSDKAAFQVIVLVSSLSRRIQHPTLSSEEREWNKQKEKKEKKKEHRKKEQVLEC